MLHAIYLQLFYLKAYSLLEARLWIVFEGIFMHRLLSKLNEIRKQDNLFNKHLITFHL